MCVPRMPSTTVASVSKLLDFSPGATVMVVKSMSAAVRLADSVVR